MSERRPSSATARRRKPPIAAISDSTPRAAIASWARSASSTRRLALELAAPVDEEADQPLLERRGVQAMDADRGQPGVRGGLARARRARRAAGRRLPRAGRRAAGTSSSPDAPLRARVWARSARSAGAGATTASELAGTITRSDGSRTSSAGTRARSTRTQPTPRASSPAGTGAPIESASGSSVARISWSGGHRPWPKSCGVDRGVQLALAPPAAAFHGGHRRSARARAPVGRCVRTRGSRASGAAPTSRRRGRRAPRRTRGVTST